MTTSHPISAKATPPMSFVIKVCGITSVEDGQCAVNAGATALGFNFYPHSPRAVNAQQAKSLIGQIEGDYLRVGVFVNAEEAELLAAVSIGRLDVLQLHGTVPSSLPSGVRIWRAAAADYLPTPDAAFEAYLLDTPSPEFGGSGVAFDWKIAARFPARFLVAGGLHGGNVAAAIAAARPSGVDACSRLELVPGRKDPALVRDFVRAALDAQCRYSAYKMVVTS